MWLSQVEFENSKQYHGTSFREKRENVTFSVNLTHSPSCVGSAARRVLDEVDEGLGVHAGVVLAYGARSVSHLDTFDAGDIKTAADNFRAAGVAPLQCKWIMKSLTDRVAAGREAPPRRQRHRTALQAARENKCRRRHRRCRRWPLHWPRHPFVLY